MPLKHDVIEGETIYLRQLKAADVNQVYSGWMNDPEVTQFVESRFEKWPVDKLRDYIDKIGKNPDYLFLAIISKDKNRHIGNIKIGPINRIHGFSDIGLIIGEKTYWGRGIATEAIKLVVDYAFNKLGLHKLTAGAYANNLGSVKAFKKAGFSVEGIKKEQYIHKDSYVDSVLLGILRK